MKSIPRSSSISEGIDVENPIFNPSRSSKSTIIDEQIDGIGYITLTFPLPSKDPLIDHKKAYDLSKSLRLDDTVSSSLNNISKVVQNNNIPGDSILKLNNTFLWNENNTDTNTSIDINNDKVFSYYGTISIASLIVSQTGCDILLHINNIQQSDIGECAINLNDLLDTDSNHNIRSKTVQNIPLTNGSKLIGEIKGHFTMKILAEVNEKK
jgi:hypothetical protein